MNALWLERICSYRHGGEYLETCRRLIDIKVRQSYILLHKYDCKPYTYKFPEILTYPKILLYEGRVAKQYWKLYKTILPTWTHFKGRKPHALDIVNRLLDIGYHHITQKVIHLLDTHEVSSAVGLLHRAHKSTSHPLVYDLVELFRADLVDEFLIHFVRQTKKPIDTLTSKHISRFLHNINLLCKKKHYLRDFKQCHTYEYYMELQVLKLIKAINHKEVFNPIILPSRHDDRCV